MFMKSDRRVISKGVSFGVLSVREALRDGVTARYDAQQVVDGFAQALSTDDSADLVGGLTAVVEKTLQPKTVGIWIANK